MCLLKKAYTWNCTYQDLLDNNVILDEKFLEKMERKSLYICPMQLKVGVKLSNQKK